MLIHIYILVRSSPEALKTQTTLVFCHVW